MKEELERIMHDLSILQQDFTHARENGAVENLSEEDFDRIVNLMTNAWVSLERIRLIINKSQGD